MIARSSSKSRSSLSRRFALVSFLSSNVVDKAGRLGHDDVRGQDSFGQLAQNAAFNHQGIYIADKGYEACRRRFDAQVSKSEQGKGAARLGEDPPGEGSACGPAVVSLVFPPSPAVFSILRKKHSTRQRALW